MVAEIESLSQAETNSSNDTQITLLKSEFQSIIQQLLSQQDFTQAIETAIQRAMLNSTANPKQIKDSVPILETLERFNEFNLYDRNRDASTSASYISDTKSIEAFITQKLQRPALTSDLIPANLHEFVTDRRKSGVAETTLERQCQGIISYSDFLCDQDFLREPLTLKAAKIFFRKRRQHHPRISEQQYRQLMACISEPAGHLQIRDWALFNFLYYTTTPVTVTLSLKQPAVDLAAEKIYIRDRIVTLRDPLLAILKHYLGESKPNTEIPLFPSRSGRHLCAVNYREIIFKPAIRRFTNQYKFKSCHPSQLPKEILEALLAKPIL